MVPENRLIPLDFLLDRKCEDGYWITTDICERLRKKWHIDFGGYTNSLGRDCALLVCKLADL